MPARSLALTRTLIGLLQGGFLYLLYYAVEAKSWPATDPYALAMMTTAGSAVPLLAVSGLGNSRLRTLLAWLVVATLLCCGIAAYGVYRGPALTNGLLALSIAPALFVIFFILQSLIMASEADRRIVAAALVTLWTGTPLLAYLFTDPAYTGRGIGRGLVEAVIDALGEQGHTLLSLAVTDANKRARSLYESIGFRPHE